MTTSRTFAKKTIAAISGAALLGLTGLFNAAAQADAPAVPSPAMQGQIAAEAQARPAVPAAITLPAPVTAMDEQLIAQLNAVAALIEAGYEASEGAYNPALDPAVTEGLADVTATLRAGANGNIFAPPSGQKVMGASDLSAFAMGIIIATQTGQPALVEEFLAAGADAKQVAPDTYTPMDYAILDFMNGQFANRAWAESSFAIIQSLEHAGARTADARNIRLGRNPMTLMIADYNGLVKSLMGREVIEQAGGRLTVTVDELMFGGDAVLTDLQDEPRLTRAFVEGNGGRLVQQDYSEAYPGGPEVYTAQPGDTLASIAMRFHVVMGERSALHAMSALMNLNDMDAHAALRPGQRVLIPKPAEVQIVMPIAPRDMTVREFLVELEAESRFYIPGASMDDIIRAIAQVNGMDPAEAVADQIMVRRGSPLVMLHRNDSYDFLPRLTPPPGVDPARRVELVVIEGGAAGPDDTQHQKRTYGSATSANFAINPDVDFTRFYAWREHFMSWPELMGESGGQSPALRALLAATDNPLRDTLIFTQSMEISVGQPSNWMNPKWAQMDEVMQQSMPEDAAIEAMRMALDVLERTEPIIFAAAGNQFANGEGPYKQAFPATHGPRSYVIGAAGKYNAYVDGQLLPAYIMSHYSTGGADMCAPLPTFLNEQQEGTSFSTPLFAGLFRQELEWFGNRLSPEEMMAAALMTADRNVLDYDSPITIGTLPFDRMYSAHMATFNTNGAGLPYHARCGAGVMDMQAWHDALLLMLDLKAAPDINGQETSQTIAIGEPVQVPDENGNGNYVYRIAVPQDMTLGKLTFLIPQYAGRHSDITVTSPSGFSQEMPRSMFQTISSHAFAYEDVQAGQFIEISTEHPLAPGAEITVRGHTGENAIARLRDVLQANGTLPAPLVTIGGQPADFPLPAAPTNAVVGDTIAVPESISVAPDAEDTPAVPDQEAPPAVPPAPAPLSPRVQ